MAVKTTRQEKTLTFRMQKVFRNAEVARALLEAAPETQPYRNAGEVRKLFQRLGINVKEFQTFDSCFMVLI
jgi:hypothetical protein